MRKLETLTILNFKSIHELRLELNPLNVFIGGNGAGKSNLIEVFRFLREIVNQNLAGYTATKGGADALLRYGRKTSRAIQFSLTFGEGNTTDTYHVALSGTDNDELFIDEEFATFNERDKQPVYQQHAAGHVRESELRSLGALTSQSILRDLESYRVYHFHDTSDHAGVRGTADVDDNRFLRPEAENLAAFLYWLQEREPAHMANIRDTIRQVAPFFDDFRLAPLRLNPTKIRLEWHERGTDTYFNASSLSDGTLRFICLVTLLLQPTLPSLVLLDEPELGLHPAAVALLADLLESAAQRTQVIVATQSVTLVNQLAPHQVWTVDRANGESVFSPLDAADMTDWLENYALGELWEKGVLGARP